MRAVPFDMLQLIPPRLDAEINGYNGRLLKGVTDGFNDFVDRCGTKWPHAHNLDVSHAEPATFDADFETPWSPPSPDVLSALSGRYGVTVVHWFAESGTEIVRQIDSLDCLYEYGIGMSTIQELVNNLREEQEQARLATVPAAALGKALRLAGEFLRLADTEGGEGAAARLYRDEIAAIEQVRKALEN